MKKTVQVYVTRWKITYQEGTPDTGRECVKKRFAQYASNKIFENESNTYLLHKYIELHKYDYIKTNDLNSFEIP